MKDTLIEVNGVSFSIGEKQILKKCETRGQKRAVCRNMALMKERLRCKASLYRHCPKEEPIKI